MTNGQFELTVAMPSDITDNFREATISMFAYSDDGMTDASGLDRSCHVYGYDEEAAEDNEPPVIELLAINHPSFSDGDEVNPDPMVIATINDNVGINLSMAGIGRQMSIMLDDKRSYNDVPFYFTPASDGSPRATSHIRSKVLPRVITRYASGFSTPTATRPRRQSTALCARDCRQRYSTYIPMPTQRRQRPTSISRTIGLKAC